MRKYQSPSYPAYLYIQLILGLFLSAQTVGLWGVPIFIGGLFLGLLIENYNIRIVIDPDDRDID